MNDHACLTFGEPAELLDLTAAFIRDGLLAALKVVWVTDLARARVVPELAGRGIAVVLGVEGVAEEHLPGEGTGQALGDPAAPHRPRGRAVRVDGRLYQIMALTSDGLDPAGIRKVLELQEETRRVQTELIRLTAAAHAPGQALLLSVSPVDQTHSATRRSVSDEPGRPEGVRYRGGR